MRYRNKTTNIIVVLRLVVGLATSLFVLSLTNPLIAEDVTSHQGRFGKWNVEPVECGDVLENGRFELTGNLNCPDDDPAITIIGPATLNLKSNTLSGVPVCEDEDDCNLNDCIRIEGDGAKVWNGRVANCADGVVIAGTGRHQVFRITSMDNDKTGFKLDEDSNDNWLTENEAIYNKKENFLIEKKSNNNHLIKNIAKDGEDRGYYVRGSNNRLYKNKAYGNLNDALRIRNGTDNIVIHNIFNNTESEAGIKIDSKGNIVRKNFIKQNDRGIRIRSNDNEVVKNIIINNSSEGIRVELDNNTDTPSSNNIISSNLILNNGQEGIRVEDSSSNFISKNIIKNNGFIESDPEAIRDGLKLEKEAYENTLTKNFVFNNNGNGIYVEEGSTGNSIMRNIVFSNGDDIDDYFDLNDGNDDCVSNEWKRNLFRTSNLECIQ
jgi:parallel beta-helix repeat protein